MEVSPARAPALGAATSSPHRLREVTMLKVKIASLASLLASLATFAGFAKGW
jgi:hypothetical protein